MHSTLHMLRKRGFSLVELSIVLVILGLLTGGILAGQSLIRASELRSLSSEQSRYVAAIHTFRDKYLALPGDITNATSFWGFASGTTGLDTGCYATNSTNALTCNGDGNGQLFTQCDQRGGECTRAWQHMANAGLIEGSFRGGKGVATTFISTDGPNPKVSPTMFWFPYYFGNFAGSTTQFAGNYGNALFIYNVGATTVTYNTTSAGPLLPEEAWNIDTKMDDGRPATGSVIGYKGSATQPCTSRANTAVDTTLDPAANYSLTNTSKACTLFFANAG